MREQIVTDLSTHLDPGMVVAVLDAYEAFLSKHRAGDCEAALAKGGRFVEQVLRLIEGKRTGIVPPEIKSVAATVKTLESDPTLPESLKLLIPRVLYGMIYNLRSKRDVVHVKETDPTGIDVAMAISGASWTIAELLRLYHVSDERVVKERMLALTRTSIPFVEALGGEIFVGRNVKPVIELLLLLAHAGSDGLTRTALGIQAKCSAPSVTKGLQWLDDRRFIHRAQSGVYYIASGGEAHLASYLTSSSAEAA